MESTNPGLAANGALNPLVVMPNDVELETKALSIPEKAERIQVLDQATYTAACLFLRDTVAAMRREIIDHHRPMKQAADRAHQAICDAEKTLLEPIKRAEELLKERIAVYDAEQTRIQQEQERIALAEAQRKRDEATEAALEQAERDGASQDEVRAIIDEPMAIAKPFVSQTHERVSGIVARKTYKGRVVNLREFLTAILNGKATQNLISINESTLNGLARQYGQELSRFVPGTIAIEDTTISTRRSR